MNKEDNEELLFKYFIMVLQQIGNEVLIPYETIENDIDIDTSKYTLSILKEDNGIRIQLVLNTSVSSTARNEQSLNTWSDPQYSCNWEFLS